MSNTKYLYVYHKCELPKYGWIQKCFECESPTSNTILFHKFIRNDYNYKCHVHICKKCNKKMNNNKIFYKTIINNSYTYLYKNYCYLISSRT